MTSLHIYDRYETYIDKEKNADVAFVDGDKMVVHEWLPLIYLAGSNVISCRIDGIKHRCYVISNHNDRTITFQMLS